MFRMPFKLLNKHFLCSEWHVATDNSFSKILRSVPFYVLAVAARAAGTVRTTPTLQNDRKFKFEEQKGVLVYSSGWGWIFLEFGEEGRGKGREAREVRFFYVPDAIYAL